MKQEITFFKKVYKVVKNIPIENLYIINNNNATEINLLDE